MFCFASCLSALHKQHEGSIKAVAMCLCQILFAPDELCIKTHLQRYIWSRFPTLGVYPSWQLLLKEWKERIPFLTTTVGTSKQTVPMERPQEDLAEGVQKEKSSSYPWRNVDRNSIRDRKIVIYGMLQAEREGKDLKKVMSAHVAAAEKAMKGVQRGAKTTLLTYIRRSLSGTSISCPKWSSSLSCLAGNTPTKFSSKLQASSQHQQYPTLPKALQLMCNDIRMSD